MKQIVMATALSLVSFAAFASGHSYGYKSSHSQSFGSSYSQPAVHVSGYTTKSGNYVAPYMRTAPNNTKVDNWSSRPNVNPYTGQVGTKDPYSTGH